jgi:hypothetical protein
MKSIALSRLLLLTCVAGPIGAGSAQAVQLSFSLYALSVPVAESSMEFALEPAGYSMGLQYRTTGLATIVASGALKQSSKGIWEHDQPFPSEFRSYVRLHGKDRTVNLAYRNANPFITEADPTNESEREIVPPARLEHTFDPLSAMVDMLHVAQQTGKCDISHNTYDGRRLESFVARTVDYEDIPQSSRSIFSGRALRCDYTSTPLAGIRIGDGHEEDARVRTGTIWLAPLTSGGPRLPVQGLIDIRILGSATMYLTKVVP